MHIRIILKSAHQKIIKKMKRIIFAILSLVLVGCNKLEKEKVSSDDFIDKFERLVLHESIINKEFKIIEEDSLKINEHSFIYLGDCQNKKVNLIYHEVLSGNKISPHLNTYLSVYSLKNVKLGGYYIGSNKPKLINEILTFENIEKCNLSTEISFKDSIPQKIFIHCKEENGEIFGDLYNFEKR